MAFPQSPPCCPWPCQWPLGNVVARREQPKVFNQLCIACHSLGGQGGVVGPALDDVGSRRDYNNLVVWLTDPQQVKPGTLMPKLPVV